MQMLGVDLWKRSFQRTSGVPERKNGNEEDESELETLRRERQGLEQRVRVLETRLTYKEAQLVSFEEKTSGLRVKLEEKERELEAVSKDRELKSKQRIHDLKMAVRMLEVQKAGWAKKEETFLSELQEFASALEDKCEALNREAADVRMEKERCRSLEASLMDKVRELSCSRDAHAKSQRMLNSCQAELVSLRADKEGEVDRLRRKLEETEAALANKEVEVTSMKKEVLFLRENNSGLKSTVQSFEDKVLKLLEVEIQRQRLEASLAAAESKLAANKEVISDLELKVEAGNVAEAELADAKSKILELDSMLGKLMEEKDEKLDASEWTVRHLGLHEVPKTKASLAQVEKEHAQLKQDFAYLEKKLNLKDEQLSMELHVVDSLKRRILVLENESATLLKTVEDHEVRYQNLKLAHDAARAQLDQYSNSLQVAASSVQTNDCMLISSDVDKLKEVRAGLQSAHMSSQDLMEEMIFLRKSLVDDKNLVRDQMRLLQSSMRESQPAETRCGKRDRTSTTSSWNPEEEEEGKRLKRRQEYNVHDEDGGGKH